MASVHMTGPLAQVTLARTEADRPELAQVAALGEIGRQFWRRGWSLGGSGSFSVVVERQPLRLLITTGGADKNCLASADFTIVDQRGAAVDPADPTPTDDSALHALIAEGAGAGAVLHTHSVWATLLADLYAERGGLAIEGDEMLQNLGPAKTGRHRRWVPVLVDEQDYMVLSKRLAACLRDPDEAEKSGLLLRGCGLYAWGKDLPEARCHTEAYEFLFESIGRRLALEPAR